MKCVRHRGSGTRTWRERGQALAEFAVVVPILLFLALATADLGRVYLAMIQNDSASREAADYGAYRWFYWNDTNVAQTQAEMVRRACSASLGLADYVGAADGSTCTNPEVTVVLEGPGCSVPLTSNPDPSCIVHVTTRLTFRTLLQLPGLPDTVTLQSDSKYATGWVDTP